MIFLWKVVSSTLYKSQSRSDTHKHRGQPPRLASGQKRRERREVHDKGTVGFAVWPNSSSHYRATLHTYNQETFLSVRAGSAKEDRSPESTSLRTRASRAHSGVIELKITLLRIMFWKEGSTSQARTACHAGAAHPECVCMRLCMCVCVFVAAAGARWLHTHKTHSSAGLSWWCLSCLVLQMSCWM